MHCPKCVAEKYPFPTWTVVSDLPSWCHIESKGREHGLFDLPEEGILP